MANVLNLTYLRFATRALMALALSGIIYLAFFILKNLQHPTMSEYEPMVAENKAISAPIPALDLKSSESIATLVKERDIFSSDHSGDANTMNLQETPAGQLPSHLKVVGIMNSKPSQVIIEDTLTKQTYFITEANPQGGISLVHVDGTQVQVSYQGEIINITTGKNSNATSNNNVQIP
jgi:type II secretory pathway component PulC